MKKSLKVAISQRICPEFRVPLFQEIAKRSGIDFTLFFGKGLPSGSSRNAKDIEGFKYIKLFTIPFYFNDHGIEKYRVFHPTLPFHLLFGSYDIVITEPSTNFFNNIFIFPICKMLGIKFIWYTAGSPKVPSHLRRMISPFVNTMIRHSDACITYNSVADSDLIKVGVAKNKIFRAQNSLDTKQMKLDVQHYKLQVSLLRKNLGLERTKVALFIGGIEKRKRIENLIQAASIMRSKGLNIKVLIIGDGPYSSELKARLSEEEKNNTIFAGRHVKDAALYILASDIVVLPGQGGLAINHALACGRPCIATEEAEGPAVHDYISDGLNGFVVPINDVQALAEKMELMLYNKKLWKSLCAGARDRSEELTIEKMVDSICEAIQASLQCQKNHRNIQQR